MEKHEIFEAMATHPVMHLATVEGDQPHVRAVFLYKADESGILFHMAKKREMYTQIVKNNKAELCFNCEHVQIRVTGHLDEIDDNDLKDEICEHPSRAFLKNFRENGAFEDFYRDIAVFRLSNGMASLWSMDKNFAPKEMVQI
jgi:uncharacterized pyridoxamine 5'-phosphate oxidase family protein